MKTEELLQEAKRRYPIGTKIISLIGTVGTVEIGESYMLTFTKI